MKNSGEFRSGAGIHIVTAVVFIVFVWVFSFLSPLAGAADRFEGKLFVPPPPFTPGIFPCSRCHSDKKINVPERELKAASFHYKVELKHVPGGWCFDCHSRSDRDSLKLADGTLISFEESYRLCGQCHGTILRQWKNGIHGKRTGSWSGEKQHLLCVHCHSPHEPPFKPIGPLPPPVRPSEIK
jgi:hypothetical protein